MKNPTLFIEWDFILRGSLFVASTAGVATGFAACIRIIIIFFVKHVCLSEFARNSFNVLARSYEIIVPEDEKPMKCDII